MTNNEFWIVTITILVVSFGVAALTGGLVAMIYGTRKAPQPGVEAYIDDLAAGNGTRLIRPER